MHLDGETTEIIPTSQMGFKDNFYQKNLVEIAPAPKGETQKSPLGTLYGARSGDKGGCANLGVWAKTDVAYSFLFTIHQSGPIDNNWSRFFPTTARKETWIIS